MERDSQQYKEALYEQIQEQYGKLVYTYTCHLKKAAMLKKESGWFKWAQIVLSAISTGGFIATVITDQAKFAWIGGIISTLLLVVSGYLKDKDFVGEQRSHIETSNKLWLLREQYLSLLTDFWTMESKDVVKTRDVLMQRTSEVYNSAPQTDEKAYKATQYALKNGQEQFFTQDELNIMLPAHLRK